MTLRAKSKPRRSPEQNLELASRLLFAAACLIGVAFVLAVIAFAVTVSR